MIDLRCEFRSNPETVTNPAPRFGWRTKADGRSFSQSAYQILVASSREILSEDRGDLWDSGAVLNSISQAVPYAGKPLQPGLTAFWKVRVREEDGEFIPWSEPAQFQFAAKDGDGGALPDPLFPGDSRRRTKLSTNDAKINTLYEAAQGALPKISGMRDTALTLRAAMYQSDEAHSRGENLFRSANEAANAGGLYPASLPPDGSFASTQSDAPILMAHALWWMSGDASLLTEYWPQMMSYVTARQRLDPERKGKALGTLPEDTLPRSDRVPPALVHQLSMALDLRLMHGMNRAAMRGPFEVLKLRQWIQAYRESFERAHLREDGSLKYDSLTAHLLTLRSGILTSEESKALLVERVVKLLDSLDRSAFDESPWVAYSILPVLTFTGNIDRAVKLVREQNADELSPQAILNISEWLVSMVAGIETEDLGFKHIRLAPYVPSRELLGSCEAQFDSNYGVISTSWRYVPDGWVFEAVTPPNTTVLFQFQIAEGQSITTNGQEVKSSADFTSYRREGNHVSFRADSGKFSFRIAENDAEDSGEKE